MREIKFDFVARNIHFDEIHHNVYTLDQIWDGREILTWLKSDNCEMIARRLYTGLLDKNGVEIYEGDIVRQFHTVDGATYVRSKKAIEWVSSEMRCGWNIARGGQWEVIGNIHENPELLTPELSSKEKDE